MARYIYIWELGGGMGHLQRMHTVSMQLKAAGHEVLWYVPPDQLSSAHTFWPNVRAANIEPRPKPRVLEPGSFAEILQNEGWDQPNRVAAWIRHWQQEFANSHADHLLLDFAPNALLAAISDRRKVEVIGTGFYIPPKLHPLPAFREDQGVYADRLLWAERQLVAVLTEVLKLPLNGLCDLLHHTNAKNHLLTYPEWDHYPDRKNNLHHEVYSGLITAFAGARAIWPEPGQRRVFAYLKPFPGLPILLETFHQMNLSVLVHGNSAVAALVKAMNRKQIEFCEQAVDERSIAEAGAVMINHAGHDGTIKAALAGLALWQLPLNVEQLLTARNAQKLGLSEWTHAHAYAEFPAALCRLFEQQDQHQQAARRWGSTVKDLQPAITLFNHHPVSPASTR